MTINMWLALSIQVLLALFLEAGFLEDYRLEMDPRDPRWKVGNSWAMLHDLSRLRRSKASNFRLGNSYPLPELNKIKGRCRLPQCNKTKGTLVS